MLVHVVQRWTFALSEQKYAKFAARQQGCRNQGTYRAP
jgi:hypothetical protein